MQPAFTIGKWKGTAVYKKAEDAEHLFEGLAEGGGCRNVERRYQSRPCAEDAIRSDGDRGDRFTRNTGEVPSSYLPVWISAARQF